MIKFIQSFFKPIEVKIRVRTRSKFRITCGDHYFNIITEEFTTLEDIRNRILFCIEHQSHISNHELPVFNHHFNTRLPIIIHEIYKKQTIF